MNIFPPEKVQLLKNYSAVWSVEFVFFKGAFITFLALLGSLGSFRFLGSFSPFPTK
jgi:hypothetical protein